MSQHASFGSPGGAAERDFALLMLLSGGNRAAAQEQLVAAARAGLDASELQDSRGSKRAPARTPPPKAASPRPPLAGRQKKSRWGANLHAALAAAAQPAAALQQHTATNYITAALAAANPRRSA